MIPIIAHVYACIALTVFGFVACNLMRGHEHPFGVFFGAIVFAITWPIGMLCMVYKGLKVSLP